ncbi:hypothetical protein KAJ41_02020 [Candidatus Parcubacteria bacterium]|nr:hypothetical protein [Candidatus Parcubacteria bacterium]
MATELEKLLQTLRKESQIDQSGISDKTNERRFSGVGKIVSHSKTVGSPVIEIPGGAPVTSAQACKNDMIKESHGRKVTTPDSSD